MSNQTLKWQSNLTGEALKIATLDHSPIRVMAGPGTGKTYALMNRVARLLHEGADPHKMLVCTFTRTSAKDLSQELHSLQAPGAQQISISTLHALCFKILSAEDYFAHYGRIPRLLLAYEERFLLEDMRNVDIYGNYNQRCKRLQAFKAAWARLQNEQPGWPLEDEDRHFQADVMNWLQFHQSMLVGELVPETLKYLRNNPTTCYLNRFEQVFVDEYQDLNKAEQELLELLSAHSSYFIIGDEDQSIYSFKYAHPDGIIDFHLNHPGTLDSGLENCRRCPQKVVAIANNLIKNNSNRTNRKLNPYRDDDGEVHVVQWASIEDEALGLARLVSDRIASGKVTPGQILILATRKCFAEALRNELLKNSIPAQSFFSEDALTGNPKKLDDSSNQQAFCLLSLLVNRDDAVALRCWCGFGQANLGANSWRYLKNYCESSGTHPWKALTLISEGKVKVPYTVYLVQRFKILLKHLSELNNNRGNELLDTLFPIKDNTDAIREIVARIETVDYTAEELYNALKIAITQPELITDVEYVRLMSLHKSKGLTANMVIVTGCIEGLLPHSPEGTPEEKKRALEEQRRLFYVAITRARETLIISSTSELPRKLAHRITAKVHNGRPGFVKTMASSFISELGPQCPPAVRGEKLLLSLSREVNF